MKRVLHIFRKDVRHLWPSILIVMVLAGMHAVFDVLSWPVYNPETNRTNAIASLLGILLPLGLWFLIAQLIFQEALPGDRQFWLTRPYRWGNLLAAKVLFVFVFGSIPLFLSDCYILGVQRLGVFDDVPTLFLRQGLLAALFLLPAFALATVTSGLLQFVLAWFVLLLVMVMEMVLMSHGSSVVVSSVVPYLLAFTATFIGVALWQYAQRRTTIARVVLLAVTCAVVPVMMELWRLPFFYKAPPILPASPKGFDIRVRYDLDRPSPASRGWQGPPEGFVLARIPLAVEGLPPGTLLRGNAPTTVRIAGRVWPEPKQMWAGSVEREEGEYWQTLTLQKARLNELGQRSVSLHASFDFEVVNDRVETTISLAKESFHAPHLGYCRVFSFGSQTNLSCKTGVAPAVETTLSYGLSQPTAGQTIVSTPENAVPWGLSPTTNNMTVGFNSDQAPTELSLIPRRKVTKFHRTLDAPSVELSRYVLGSPRVSLQ
jgi:hypothetical protein